MTQLVLKRGKFSSGEWNDEDYDVLDDGAKSRGQITRSDAAPQTSPALHLRSALESRLPQRLAFHSGATDSKTVDLTSATPAVTETQSVYVDPCATHRSDTHRVERFRTQPRYYVAQSRYLAADFAAQPVQFFSSVGLALIFNYDY
jgi:hypothetical protein